MSIKVYYTRAEKIILQQNSTNYYFEFNIWLLVSQVSGKEAIMECWINQC